MAIFIPFIIIPCSVATYIYPFYNHPPFSGLSELTKSLREQHPGSYESLEKFGALSIVELCSIEQTLEETQFASKEVKNSVPWNVEFCIGDLAVPITGYKWVINYTCA